MTIEISREFMLQEFQVRKEKRSGLITVDDVVLKLDGSDRKREALVEELKQSLGGTFSFRIVEQGIEFSAFVKRFQDHDDEVVFTLCVSGAPIGGDFDALKN